jgi:uncharacterized membrane protein YtjA (UPF0391 family)
MASYADRQGEVLHPGRRLFIWILANADALIALVLAVVVSTLGFLGVASTALVAKATVVTLAVLAFVLLQDRRRHMTTLEAITRLDHKVDRRNPVRVLSGRDISRVLAEARRDTDRWFFRGSTATYVRAVTLPECISHARSARRELHIRLEILDPTSNAACQHYVRLHQSFAEGPNSPEQSWTVPGTRVELYATILAACWHAQRYRPLSMQIGLSTVASTFRWELSSGYFILTQRGPRFPAMVIEKSDPYYAFWASELNASFQQARIVPVDIARDIDIADDPTVDEVRAVFATLGLDLRKDEFQDAIVQEIISKALHDSNPYASPDS